MLAEYRQALVYNYLYGDDLDTTGTRVDCSSSTTILIDTSIGPFFYKVYYIDEDGSIVGASETFEYTGGSTVLLPPFSGSITEEEEISMGNLANLCVSIPKTGLSINSCDSIITVDTPSSEGTVNCDLAVSNWHQITITQNTVITLINPSVNQQSMFRVVQGDSSAYTVEFSGLNIRWPGGTVPDLTEGGIDVLTLKHISGTDYDGFIAGQGLDFPY